MRAVRSLELWELVRWTYRDQKAHLYLKSPGDWFDWMVDRQDINRELNTNVAVHYDAAMVHAAVICYVLRVFASASASQRSQPFEESLPLSDPDTLPRCRKGGPNGSDAPTRSPKGAIRKCPAQRPPPQ